MNFDRLTRPCVRNVTPYFPGKPVAEVRRELSLSRVVKLASNENPYGSSPRAQAALKRASRELHRYPEGSSPLLREAFAALCRVQPSQVVIGSGSDELIRLLCEVLLSPDDEVVVSQHSFIRFKQHAALMGAKVIEVPMTDWTHDLETMGRAASARTKLVFVANPNNPTGTYNSRAEILALLDRLPEQTLLVVDEAYYHYAESEADYPRDLPTWVRRRPNLVVLRTFSKAYGLAGSRVGAAVADQELVGWLDRVRLPFNAGLPAQEAALAALADKPFLRRCVGAVRRHREALARRLRGLGLCVGDSAANFLFVQTPLPGRELFRRLLEDGVVIRPLDEYGLTHHARISVGTPGENRALVRALERALEAP